MWLRWLGSIPQIEGSTIWFPFGSIGEPTNQCFSLTLIFLSLSFSLPSPLNEWMDRWMDGWMDGWVDIFLKKKKKEILMRFLAKETRPLPSSRENMAVSCTTFLESESHCVIGPFQTAFQTCMETNPASTSVNGCPSSTSPLKGQQKNPGLLFLMKSQPTPVTSWRKF